MPNNKITQKPASCIEPGTLYTLPGFKTCSGLGDTSLREARKAGLFLPTITVGRRKFIRGADAIEYIEALAELSAANSPA